jgi:hypothetical protein
MQSISEKFALLSLPRSRHSSAKLHKQCFSMRIVRDAIARSIDACNRHERCAPYERTFNLDLSSPSSGSSPESELVSRPQWMRDAQPDLSDEEADAIWIAGSHQLLGEAAHLSSGPNPSSFTGGNTLKVTAEIHHSAKEGPVQARVALDTQARVALDTQSEARLVCTII